MYALATPAFYSISNFIDKYLIDKKIREPMAITAVSSIVAGMLGLLVGFITGFKMIGYSQIALIMLGGMLLTFYLMPYFEAMKLEDASRVVPLFQFIPVFTLILSSMFLHESLSLKQILGLFLVVLAGVSLGSDHFGSRLFKPRKSLVYMLLASFMYGSVGILFRLVVKESSFWSTLSYEYIGSGIAGIILLFLPRVYKNIEHDIDQMKSAIGMIIFNNGVAEIAQISESVALSKTSVPLVNLIGSLQPLISLVEGFVLTKKFPQLIKEDIRPEVIRGKLLSIGLILIGLVLVYF